MKLDMVELIEIAPARTSKKQYVLDMPVWSITLDQIESITGHIKHKEYTTVASAPQSSNLIDEDNVLYSKLRPYLNKVIIPDSFGFATTELVPLYPDKTRLCNKYLLYYLRSDKFVNWASKTVAGAKMPRLNMKEFWRHKIPLPPLETQKRIVEILDRAQDLIDKRKEQIELMDQLIQSLFYDMFGDPVKNPKGWEVGKIADLAFKTQYGTSKKAHETIGNYPILRMNNITYVGGWDFANLKYIEFDETEQKKYLVYKNDILFNRTNSKELVGKTAVYRKNKPMAFAGYLVKLIVNNKGNPEYISSYLNSKHGKSFLINKAKSIVGMANINAEELKSITINIPPVNLQNTFADRVKKIEAQKEAMTTSLKELENNFNSLMQRAFKGELDV